MVLLVHMIWLQGECNIPERFKKNLDLWRRHTKIKVWDDIMIKGLITTHFPELLKIYDNYPIFVQRADLGRYVILYIYGGLYLDIDTKPIDSHMTILWRRLQEVPDGTVVFPGPNVPYNGIPSMDAKICNWFIYTPQPGLPFLKTCLNNIGKHTQRGMLQLRSYYVSASTGAVFLTKYMDESCRTIPVHDTLINEYAGTWGKLDDRDAVLIAAFVIIILVILLLIVWGIRRFRQKYSSSGWKYIQPQVE